MESIITIIKNISNANPAIGTVNIPSHGIAIQLQLPSWQGSPVVSSDIQAPTNPTMSGDKPIKTIMKNHNGSLVK